MYEQRHLLDEIHQANNNLDERMLDLQFAYNVYIFPNESP